MIIYTDPSKKGARGEIVCGVCGVFESHPTLSSDRWSACWCPDPDRCPSCGICSRCFPDWGTGPYRVTIEGYL